MTKVKFNHEDEFIEELNTTPASDIRRHVLRITNTYQASKMTPVLQELCIRAGFMVNLEDNQIELIELVRRVGDLMVGEHGDGNGNKLVYERADELAAKLKQAASNKGLTVLAGLYEAPEPAPRIQHGEPTM